MKKTAKKVAKKGAVGKANKAMRKGFYAEGGDTDTAPSVSGGRSTGLFSGANNTDNAFRSKSRVKK